MTDDDRYPDPTATPWGTLASDPTADPTAASGPAKGTNAGTGPTPTVDDMTGDDWVPYQPVDDPAGEIPEYEEEIDEVPPPSQDNWWFQLAECGVGTPLTWWIQLARNHTTEAIRIGCRFYAVLKNTEQSSLPDGGTEKTADESFDASLDGWVGCGRANPRYVPVTACVGGGTKYALVSQLTGVLTGSLTSFEATDGNCYTCTGANTVTSPGAGNIVVPSTTMAPFVSCANCAKARFTWNQANPGTFDSNTNMCHGLQGCGGPDDGGLVRLDTVTAGSGTGECVKRLTGLIPGRTYDITVSLTTDSQNNSPNNSLSVTCGTVSLFIIQTLGLGVTITAVGAVTADSNGEITMTAEAADGSGGGGNAGHHAHADSIVGTSQ